MQTLDTRTLIGDLQATLRGQLQRIGELRQLSIEVLHQRPAPKRWSVLEVVQHINLSSGHYHRRLQKLYADENNRLRFRTTYTPGFWGERFTKAMLPKADGSIGWKMRTMAMFDPRHGGQARTANTEGFRPMDDLEAMLHGFTGLLERARTRGLEGEKVVSTLGPVLRFKAGDAFRFPIAHQGRHFLQIERTLAQIAAT